jgi:hypothetical protein
VSLASGLDDLPHNGVEKQTKIKSPTNRCEIMGFILRAVLTR